MAKYTMSDFDSILARKGVSVGYTDKNNDIHIATEIAFYKTRTTDYIGYVRFEDSIYEFLYDGGFYLEGEMVYLKMVSMSITQTTGTRIARVVSADGVIDVTPAPKPTPLPVSSASAQSGESPDEEVFSIATLQPREEIAMHCLEAMLSKYDMPLNIDNPKIGQLVDKSFLFAQEFINQAVLYREKETASSTVESSKYAAVDSGSLSSDTDKLLYNISSALTNMMAQSKNQYADQQKNGLKVDATVNGNIKAEVSGNVTTTPADNNP